MLGLWYEFVNSGAKKNLTLHSERHARLSRPKTNQTGIVKRFRGGLVFEAHRPLHHSTLGGLVFKAHIPLHHSTLGSRVIKKKKKNAREAPETAAPK